jgi:hypothetical protein
MTTYVDEDKSKKSEATHTEATHTEATHTEATHTEAMQEEEKHTEDTQPLRDDLKVNVDNLDEDVMPELEDIQQTTVARSQKPSEERKSGFTIKYELKDAGVKGKGIFALEDIPYGTKVWGLVEGNHFVYKNESELRERLKGQTIKDCRFILNHIWGLDNNTMLECNDDAEYVNHSCKSNLICGFQLFTPIDDDNTSCYAGRDIKAGEELTDDYSLYGVPDWYLKICKEYSVESSKDVCEKYNDQSQLLPLSMSFFDKEYKEPYFKHLVDVNMSYTEHMFLSLKLSARMAWGSFTAFVHALYPDLFITSTSSTCEYLQNELQNRKIKHKKD